MRLEDAWLPVDEIADTTVDTFIYGVSRGDGLFYPSEVGRQFGADQSTFEAAPYWRAWENMRTLLDQGVDPLAVLIDRAHQRGMEFFASLRMGDTPGMPDKFKVDFGGRGYVHPELRAHQSAVLEELATQYAVDGVELDFAAPPSGSSFSLKPDDVRKHTPTMTEFIRSASDMVRGRPGETGVVGVRVYPTEELNSKAGLDVRTWLNEGLVDFVVPLVYAFDVVDANMPIAWLVDAAHESDVSVYGMLQPYRREKERNYNREYATSAMMRAAAANFWGAGVDGLYTWSLRWPLGDVERGILTEMSDPDATKEGDKHYFLRRCHDLIADHDYGAFLPLQIPSTETGRRYEIPFVIADDTHDHHACSVHLKIGVNNLVSADALDVLLNGCSLSGETLRRTSFRSQLPYGGQWLEFDLESIRPRKGLNVLGVVLNGRPAGLVGSVTIEEVEICVQYTAS